MILPMNLFVDIIDGTVVFELFYAALHCPHDLSELFRALKHLVIVWNES